MITGMGKRERCEAEGVRGRETRKQGETNYRPY